jgi:hypothetical protein
MLLKRSHAVLFLLALMAAQPALGQAKNANGQLISPIAFVNEEAITTTFIAAPSVGGIGGSSVGDNNQWLKVEFHYGTTAVLTTPFLDSAEFKVWIEGRDMLVTNSQGTKGAAIALTGSVTYVNIPAGKDIYGVFFVHPSTLGRYSGTGGYEDFDRKFDIHIEAYVGGALMDEINKNPKEADPFNWFKPLTAVPNFVYRQDQCPFLMYDPDRYPAIKLPPAPAAQ